MVKQDAGTWAGRDVSERTCAAATRGEAVVPLFGSLRLAGRLYIGFQSLQLENSATCDPSVRLCAKLFGVVYEARNGQPDKKEKEKKEARRKAKSHFMSCHQRRPGSGDFKLTASPISGVVMETPRSADSAVIRSNGCCYRCMPRSNVPLWTGISHAARRSRQTRFLRPRLPFSRCAPSERSNLLRRTSALRLVG
jgi:hypothetical protein